MGDFDDLFDDFDDELSNLSSSQSVIIEPLSSNKKNIKEKKPCC